MKESSASCTDDHRPAFSDAPVGKRSLEAVEDNSDLGENALRERALEQGGQRPEGVRLVVTVSSS